jgi:hypothetical protein
MDLTTETIVDLIDTPAGKQYPRPIEILDGYVLDAEDGEIYGLVEDVGFDRDGDDLVYTPRLSAVLKPFAIDTAEKADWVLSKRAAEEAALKALALRKAAILANLEQMEEAHRRRIKHLSQRFDAELEGFARANLPKGKKTFTVPHGSVAFRAVGATVKLTDEYDATQWAEAFAPSIVRKSVSKTEVMNAWKAEEGDTVPPFAEAVPAYESVTIKTGV